MSQISADNNATEIRFMVLNPNATVPAYARKGDAACDLVSCDEVAILPGGRESVGTGIALEIPIGFAGFLLPRSGIAFRAGVTLMNSPGLIDSGFRGELKVVLYNSDNTNAFKVRVGDRIAQLVVLAVPSMSFIQVSTLSKTERGAGGFGSTGTAALA